MTYLVNNIGLRDASASKKSWTLFKHLWKPEGRRDLFEGSKHAGRDLTIIMTMIHEDNREDNNEDNNENNNEDNNDGDINDDELYLPPGIL